MRVIASAILVVAVLVPGSGCAAPRAAACVATTARSNVAWGPSDGAADIAGRVIATETGAPLASAAVLFEPGGYRASTGADGAFRLAGVPPGTYRVRVRLVGREEARASVARGREGLVMAAALSRPPRGLRECAPVGRGAPGA